MMVKWILVALGFVYKDAAGVWQPIRLAATVTPLPECETPIKNMDKCLDSLGSRQH